MTNKMMECCSHNNGCPVPYHGVGVFLSSSLSENSFFPVIDISLGLVRWLKFFWMGKRKNNTVGSIACIIDINYIYLQGGASGDNECYCHDYRYLIELYVHIKEFA